MLCIRKSKKNEPVWCEYVNGAKFLISPLTASVLEEIKKPFIKKTIGTNPDTRQVEIREIPDEDKFNDAIIDYLIQDWFGICDEDENILKCNLENKKAAMDIADISNFVFNSARAIPTFSSKKTEEDLGN